MKTIRSLNYYKNSHGKCTSPYKCELQHKIGDVLYCQDNNGWKSDHCNYFHEKLGIINDISDMDADFEYIKSFFKEVYGASFVLEVGDGKRVIYTTDDKIARIYGTKMMYYSYSFLKEKLEEQLKESK
jgi:hypothetical protein